MFPLVNGTLDYFKARSIVALILANLLPLYGVYYLGWDISQIIALYWCETIIIGVYNVLKMVYNTNEDIGNVVVSGKPIEHGKLTAAKLFMIPFFIVHYGLFTFVHGIFVFIIFIPNVSITQVVTWNHVSYLFVNVLLIFISHGISFLTHYIGNNERARAKLAGLMFSPYIRIVAMHLVLLFGGFVYLKTGRNDVSLYILIIFKIIADALSHVKQHSSLQASQAQ